MLSIDKQYPANARLSKAQWGLCCFFVFTENFKTKGGKNLWEVEDIFMQYYAVCLKGSLFCNPSGIEDCMVGVSMFLLSAHLKGSVTDLASKQVNACLMFVVTDSECTFLTQTELQFKGISSRAMEFLCRTGS